MPQVVLSQDVCVSHCLEIQVARCPPDPAGLLQLRTSAERVEETGLLEVGCRWGAQPIHPCTGRAPGLGRGLPPGEEPAGVGSAPCPRLLPRGFCCCGAAFARSSERHPCRPQPQAAGEVPLWGFAGAPGFYFLAQHSPEGSALCRLPPALGRHLCPKQEPMALPWRSRWEFLEGGRVRPRSCSGFATKVLFSYLKKKKKKFYSFISFSCC